MKIDLHGLNDRDRWPLSSGCVTDACAIFLSERKKWIKLVQKKKRVLKLIDQWKIALVSNITDLSCLSKNM